MRGLKSTIALLVVLIGLGAYIYFVASKESDTGASKLEKVFPGLSTVNINELEVKAKTGETTTLKKEGETWQITSPVQVHAGDPPVQGLTSTLVNMEVTRVIDENPTDLKQYGLDPPLMVVDFKTADNNKGERISVGDRTATGGGLYAKKNDEKRVFLIAAYTEAEINKTTFDLRDKAIVSFQRDKVDGAEVLIAGKPPIELKKAGTSWALTKPFMARADSSAVDSLIARVETAQMKTIVSEQPAPADLKTYGLDKPEVAVNLLMGSQRATLLVGGSAGGDNYAKDANHAAVVTVEPTLIGDLKKDASDYRPKGVFEFRPYDATHIEITRGGQTFVIDRVKASSDSTTDSWKRTSPNPAALDKNKTEAFLGNLADQNITSFVESKAGTGLDTPIMTVSARFGEGAGSKEEKVTFGKNGDDIYVARPGDADFGKIDATRFADTSKNLDELLK